jgi:hypothetical protein
MANIIKAGSTVNGYTTTPDQSGILEFRTGQLAGGTTALTLDASQNATLAAALTVVGAITANGSPVATTAGFQNSLTATGYQKFPGGLIIQWLPAASGAVRSWAIPFPNALLGAFYGPVSNGGSADNPYFSTLSTTQVGVTQVNGSSLNGYIIAIGH